MGAVRKREFGKIGRGDHVVFIYENAGELVSFAAPFIEDGLAAGERCLYVVDDLTRREVAGALSARGVDVNHEVRRGALVLLSAQEYYLLPPFDAMRVIEATRQRAAEADSRGFKGLRVAAEMTWALKAGLRDGAPVEDDVLVEYESVIDLVFARGAPITAACMYRRDRFPQDALRRQIGTHSTVVAGDRVYLTLSGLFQDLAATELQRLTRSARERLVPKRGFFFHQDDGASEVYLLLTGTVKLFRTDPDGRSVILCIIAPTETFGDRAALVNSTQRASAQALEDSRALVWDAATIREVVMSHPALSLNALRMLEKRVDEEQRRLQDVAGSRVEERLARMLLRFLKFDAHKTVRGVTIERPLSGRNLADLVIATPYTVSRVLAEWKRLNIVDGSHERVVILDPERLTAIAGGGPGGDPQDIDGRPA